MEWPIHSAIKFIARRACRIKGYTVITVAEAENACRIAADESIQILVDRLDARLTDQEALRVFLVGILNEIGVEHQIGNRHGTIHEGTQEGRS